MLCMFALEDTLTSEAALGDIWSGRDTLISSWCRIPDVVIRIMKPYFDAMIET